MLYHNLQLLCVKTGFLLIRDASSRKRLCVSGMRHRRPGPALDGKVDNRILHSLTEANGRSIVPLEVPRSGEDTKSDVFPALQAIAESNTLEKAARKLRMKKAKVGRLYRQLRKLGRSLVDVELGRKERSAAQGKCKGHECTTDVTHPANRHTTWSRVELYGEVWDRLLVRLASLASLMSGVARCGAD